MDRRSRKSVDSIMNAMADLLEKKPLKEILMKELADNADINRSTLYTYYKNPQEVFEDLAKRSIDSFEDIFRDQKYTMTEFIEIYLGYMKKNYPVFLEIHRSSVTNGYVERISGIMNRCLRSRKLESGTVLARYCNYGFFGIAAEWLMDGCKTSADDIIKELKPIMGVFEME